ncbi:MAG: glycosyltransferase [Candidatus Binatia bacterium]
MNTRGRIIVLGLLGQFPLAGIAWQLIHHLVGFRRLGFDVYYIEETGATPYDPRVKSRVNDCTYSVQFIAESLRRMGLEDSWAYHDGLTGQWYGLLESQIQELFANALCVVNLCGASHPDTLSFRPHGKLIYLETDPVLYQVRITEGDENARQFVAKHDVHLTYGENLGALDCPIPLPQFAWQKTRPPVVLDFWPAHFNPTCSRFTTISTWRNVGKDLSFRGETYLWSKHENWMTVADLPQRTSQQFELAVEINNQADLAVFQRNSWVLTNPLVVSQDADIYREYIQGSRGEFTVSKDVVARTRSGWFSDRSVCYLAAGKPVVTQETGFSKFIPTGRGLFAFSSIDDVVAALEAINSDYLTHAHAAREIAQEYFSAEKILSKLLRDAGL